MEPFLEGTCMQRLRDANAKMYISIRFSDICKQNTHISMPKPTNKCRDVFNRI